MILEQIVDPEKDASVWYKNEPEKFYRMKIADQTYQQPCLITRTDDILGNQFIATAVERRRVTWKIKVSQIANSVTLVVCYLYQISVVKALQYITRRGFAVTQNADLI